MFPYKDDNPTESFPVLTVGLIATNIAVFIWQLMAGGERTVFVYGARPALLLGMGGGAIDMGEAIPVPAPLTLLTSMFMHGGVMHLAGNMLYLWIFGNNIEDRLGRVRFILFYVASGVAAAYAHAISSPSSMVPMVGASGAISGILGAYVLLYPGARVHTLIVLGFFVRVVMLPALIVIGFWAIIQIANGLMSEGAGGGVAWFAHLGGFVFGLAAIKLILPKRDTRRRIEWS